MVWALKKGRALPVCCAFDCVFWTGEQKELWVDGCSVDGKLKRSPQGVQGGGLSNHFPSRPCTNVEFLGSGLGCARTFCSRLRGKMSLEVCRTGVFEFLEVILVALSNLVFVFFIMRFQCRLAMSLRTISLCGKRHLLFHKLNQINWMFAADIPSVVNASQ